MKSFRWSIISIGFLVGVTLAQGQIFNANAGSGQAYQTPLAFYYIPAANGFLPSYTQPPLVPPAHASQLAPQSFSGFIPPHFQPYPVVQYQTQFLTPSPQPAPIVYRSPQAYLDQRGIGGQPWFGVSGTPSHEKATPVIAKAGDFPETQDSVAAFRAAYGSPRARASLTAPAGAFALGEVFFYQPSPKSDVTVTVTLASAAAAPATRQILVLTDGAQPTCPGPTANNPVFNPQNVPNGGEISNPASTAAILGFTRDKISPNIFTLWGPNSIIGRSVWVGIPGGAAEMCGNIVAMK